MKNLLAIVSFIIILLLIYPLFTSGKLDGLLAYFPDVEVSSDPEAGTMANTLASVKSGLDGFYGFIGEQIQGAREGVSSALGDGSEDINVNEIEAPQEENNVETQEAGDAE